MGELNSKDCSHIRAASLLMIASRFAEKEEKIMMDSKTFEVTDKEKELLIELKERNILRFAINSDFAFQPEIGIEEAWLYIQSVSTPVIWYGADCEISLQEDINGTAHNIIKTMSEMKEFDAVLYEGTTQKYTSKTSYRCEFKRCENIKRDWDKRNEVVKITAFLSMTVK